MTRIMFRALNELKSDRIVVDKLLETTSTENYSKRGHRIKNEKKMQDVSLLLLLYITHLVACRTHLCKVASLEIDIISEGQIYLLRDIRLPIPVLHMACLKTYISNHVYTIRNIACSTPTPPKCLNITHDNRVPLPVSICV